MAEGWEYRGVSWSGDTSSDLTDRIGKITPPTEDQIRATVRLAIATAERDGWDAGDVLGIEGES